MNNEQAALIAAATLLSAGDWTHTMLVDEAREIEALYFGKQSDSNSMVPGALRIDEDGTYTLIALNGEFKEGQAAWLDSVIEPVFKGEIGRIRTDGMVDFSIDGMNIGITVTDTRRLYHAPIVNEPQPEPPAPPAFAVGDKVIDTALARSGVITQVGNPGHYEIQYDGTSARFPVQERDLKTWYPGYGFGRGSEPAQDAPALPAGVTVVMPEPLAQSCDYNTRATDSMEFHCSAKFDAIYFNAKEGDQATEIKYELPKAKAMYARLGEMIDYLEQEANNGLH